jgi:hypothetical protein
MACNSCESSFQSGSPIAVSVQRTGPTARIFVQNQGRHIALMRRIVVCVDGTWFLFLRPPPDGIPWVYPSAYLEPGLTALYYEFSPGGAQLVQAQAEFLEIDQRNRSCPA